MVLLLVMSDLATGRVKFELQVFKTRVLELSC